MGYIEAELDIEQQCGLTFPDEEFSSTVVFSDVVDLAQPPIDASQQRTGLI